jgi:purine-binding chemotaxis protein CheW
MQSKNNKDKGGTLIYFVREVLDIKPEQIEDSPEMGASVDSNFIMGMGKIGNTVKILLDIDKVLAESELTAISNDKKQSEGV